MKKKIISLAMLLPLALAACFDNLYYDVKDDLTGGMFVAVGENESRTASRDGVSWSPEQSIAGGKKLTAVAFGNGRFVAVGEQSMNYCWISEDGVNWQKGGDPKQGYSGNFNGIAYGNGTFIAVSDYHFSASTDNGKSWKVILNNPGFLFKAVTYGNGRFVAVGREEYDPGSGYSYYLATAISTDNGNQWETKRMVQVSTSNMFLSIAYGNSKFVAAGDFQNGACNYDAYYSSDGLNWTPSTTLGSFRIINSIVFAKGTFVSLDRKTILYSENNGVSWQATATLEKESNGIAWGNNLFSAINDDATTSYKFISNNASSWNKITDSTLNKYYAITFGEL